MTTSAVKQVFIDPAIGTASGTGTVGDPYGTLAYAFSTETAQSEGTQFNIRDTAPAVLTEPISTSLSGWSTSVSAPLIFKGYTSAANDLGRGIIDGDAQYSIWSDVSRDYINFSDLELRNTGAQTLINADNFIGISNCVVHNCTASRAIDLDSFGSVAYCHVYDCAGTMVYFLTDGKAIGNYLEAGVSTSVNIYHQNRGIIQDNIILAHGHTPLTTFFTGHLITNNSFLNIDAKTGSDSGLYFPSGYSDSLFVENNLFEGFTYGIRILETNRVAQSIRGNAFFDCNTNEVGTEYSLRYADNASLAVSPFAKEGAMSYANRLNYFKPTSAVPEGSPTGYRKYRGAIGPEATVSSGGGATLHPLG